MEGLNRLFPLSDENRSRTRPYITWLLIIANVLVFLWQIGRGFTNEDIWLYGAIPENVMKGESLHTLLTSMFMHGGIAHIFGNMLYLFIFGDNVEDRFGHVKYLAIYLSFGIIAGLAHGLFTYQFNSRDVSIPAVGASGAISGVLGAYMVLYPNARVVTFIFFGYFARLAKIRSIYFLGFWFLYQFMASLIDPFGGVAYWAHIGGFIIGLIIAASSKLLRTANSRVD